MQMIDPISTLCLNLMMICEQWSNPGWFLYVETWGLHYSTHVCIYIYICMRITISHYKDPFRPSSTMEKFQMWFDDILGERKEEKPIVSKLDTSEVTLPPLLTARCVKVRHFWGHSSSAAFGPLSKLDTSEVTLPPLLSARCVKVRHFWGHSSSAAFGPLCQSETLLRSLFLRCFRPVVSKLDTSEVTLSPLLSARCVEVRYFWGHSSSAAY